MNRTIKKDNMVIHQTDDVDKELKTFVIKEINKTKSLEMINKHRIKNYILKFIGALAEGSKENPVDFTKIPIIIRSFLKDLKKKKAIKTYRVRFKNLNTTVDVLI
jgi:hypothetical protein